MDHHDGSHPLDLGDPAVLTKLYDLQARATACRDEALRIIDETADAVQKFEQSLPRSIRESDGAFGWVIEQTPITSIHLLLDELGLLAAGCDSTGNVPDTLEGLDGGSDSDDERDE